MTDALCQESPDIESFLTENFKGSLIGMLYLFFYLFSIYFSI